MAWPVEKTSAQIKRDQFAATVRFNHDRPTWSLRDHVRTPRENGRESVPATGFGGRTGI
jgi:hypothetical protein